MSVTRVAIRCRVKGCPFPTSEEWHRPHCGHVGKPASHQHHRKKGMGGNNPKSEIVAVLCWDCHYLIDNTVQASNALVDDAEGTFYVAWRGKWAGQHGSNVFVRRLLRARERRA